ncbi:MAG: hypothetical protein PHU14_03275 [Methylovulum sp.]|nr:hypothetical protein [Methylovulum sp.]
MKLGNIANARPATFFTGVVSVLAVFFCFPLPVSAHVPHDVIFDVITSPAYKDDHTVYSIVRGNVVKSTNRGKSWKHLIQGIDNTTELQFMAIPPSFPSALYLSTEGDGIYKSENAGESWHKSNQGLDTLAFSKLYTPPASADVAFAVGLQRGLYRTDNGGAQWLKVYDNAVPLSAIAGFGWNSSDGFEVLVGDNNGVLSLSADKGDTWTQLYQFSGCGEISSIGTLQNPLLRNTFFVGTSKCGVFRTVDGGASFAQMNAGIEDLNIRSIVMSPGYSADATAFVSTWTKAIFISNDGGLAWKKYNTGLSTTPQAALQKAPDFQGIGMSPNFLSDKTLFLCGFAGLFQSTDGGKNWGQLTTLSTSLIISFAISPNYSLDPNLVVSTYGNGLFKSVDNGGSWQEIANNIKSRGDDVVFSPNFQNDSTMFFSTGKYTIGKSTDRGETWVKHDLPRSDFPTIIALSPGFANDATFFVGTRNSSIYRSTDAGITFTPVFDQKKKHIGHVTGLAVSPNYTNDNTLVAALGKGDVYISHNSGGSWILKGSESTFGIESKLAFSPNYTVDKTIFIASTQGLFKSTDGFDTWSKVSCDACGVDGNIRAIALSPNYAVDKTILMAVQGKGLFKSQNGGKTFGPIAVRLIASNFLFGPWNDFPAATSSTIGFSASYATDHTIFATTSERLYRSQDSGKTWQLIVLGLNLGK